MDVWVGRSGRVASGQGDIWVRDGGGGGDIVLITCVASTQHGYVALAHGHAHRFQRANQIHDHHQSCRTYIAIAAVQSIIII